MRKYKKIVTLIAFLLVACLINNLLSFAFVQSGVTRVAVHELESEDDFECVIFGQSHSSYGIDPYTVESSIGMKTMNFSIGGQYMLDMYYYVQRMYENHSPKVVVLDLDYQYFINIPKKKNTTMSTLMYYQYPEGLKKLAYAYEKMQKKEYRALLFPWMNSRDNIKHIKKIIENKFTEEYKNYESSSIKQIDRNDTYMGRGFIYKSRNLVRDNKAKVGIWWNEAAVDYEESVEYFKKIVDYCRKMGSEVMLITAPINPSTVINSKDEYHKIEQYFQNLADDTKLIYYNFNLVKPTLYLRNDTDYWDFDGHMYGDSAIRFSIALGGFMNQVLSGQDINKEDYFYSDIYDMSNNTTLVNLN